MTEQLTELFKTARELFRKDQFLPSFSVYKKILQDQSADDSTLALAFTEAGECLLNLQIWNEAEDYLRQALELDSFSANVHYLLGTILSKSARFAEAAAHFQTASKITPNNAEIKRSLGWALFMSGRPQTGEQYLMEAIEINPKNAFVYCDLAVLQMNKGDYQKAESLLREARKRSPDDPFVEDVILACRGMRKAWEEKVNSIKPRRLLKEKK